MKILFDATSISKRNGGVGLVALQLLRGISKLSKYEIVAYTRPGLKQIDGISRERLTVHELRLPFAFFGLKRFLVENIEVPLLIMKHKPEVVHYVSGFGVPIIPVSWLSSKTKVLLTIHDLIPLTPHWELMTRFTRWLHRIMVGHSLRHADKIIAISEFTAKDIKQYFPWVGPITIIPDGIEPEPNSESLPEAGALFKKYGIIKPYLFYLGGFSKRKNVKTLIEAFAKLLREDAYSKTHLVLAGKYKNNRFLEKEVRQLKEQIRNAHLERVVTLLEHLSDSEKTVLFRHAAVSLYPSLYEGFGLPVLESLIQGVPAITTSGSVMEEISQPYALCVNTKDPSTLKEAVIEVLSHRDQWLTRIRGAKKMIQTKYSWETIAQRYLQEYAFLTPGV